MPKLHSRHDAALRRLEMFTGDWDMEISGASFLPDRKTKIQGPASFRWIEHGAFLVMYQGEKVPQARWLMGRDESADTTRCSTSTPEGSQEHMR